MDVFGLFKNPPQTGVSSGTEASAMFLIRAWLQPLKGLGNSRQAASLKRCPDTKPHRPALSFSRRLVVSYQGVGARRLWASAPEGALEKSACGIAKAMP